MLINLALIFGVFSDYINVQTVRPCERGAIIMFRSNFFMLDASFSKIVALIALRGNGLCISEKKA